MTRRFHGAVSFTATALVLLGAATLTACSGNATSGFDPATPSEDAAAPSKDAGLHFVTAQDAGNVVLEKNDAGTTMNASCLASSPDMSGCACNPGDVHACYTGSAETRGVGECRDGIQSCATHGELNDMYGPCEGEVLPSGPKDCVAPVDAGIVVVDAGFDAWVAPPVDAGHDSGHDAGTMTTIATLSTTVAPPSGPVPTMGTACTTGATYAATAGNVFYCSDNIWEKFPDSTCTPTGCAACLAANHCNVVNIPNASAACVEGLQSVYNWFAGCGPDRFNYEAFATACGAAGNQASEQIEECKSSACVQGESGACSFW